MTVFAKVNGKTVEVAAHAGVTLPEFIRKLTDRSLTGSAVTLAEAEVELANGDTIRYGQADEWTEEVPFL